MFNFPLFPERASTLADKVDAVFLFALSIAVFFSLAIALAIVYFAVRYHRRNHDEVGAPAKAGMWLEVAWSVIPLGILLVMFAWGAQVYFFAFRPPADAAEYYVVGKQWMWKVQHPEGNREINELHVPVNQPVKLVLTSEDVIHSFFVPAFRAKMDAIPGRYTTLWFEATETGTYNLFCAEYCGAEHSLMKGRVVVMQPNEYQRWLSGELEGPQRAMTGAELFTAKTCNTCHQVGSSSVAPDLEGLFGSNVSLADGTTVTADEAYLRESIVDPNARVVAGYSAVMPTFQGQISEEEMLSLINYIKSLGGAAAEGPGAGVGPEDTTAATESGPTDGDANEETS